MWCVVCVLYSKVEESSCCRVFLGCTSRTTFAQKIQSLWSDDQSGPTLLHFVGKCMVVVFVFVFFFGGGSEEDFCYFSKK